MYHTLGTTQPCDPLERHFHLAKKKKRCQVFIISNKLSQNRQKNQKLFFFNLTSKGGFPGGAVVENLPAKAGDTGSSPGLGRSQMPRSSWAREPQLLSLRVWSLCSATREAATVRGPRTVMKSGPRSHRLSFSCGEQGLSFVAVRGLLTAVASPVESTGSRCVGSVVVAWGL